jgi:hypothetical protein
LPQTRRIFTIVDLMPSLRADFTVSVNGATDLPVVRSSIGPDVPRHIVTLEGRTRRSVGVQSIPSFFSL